MMVITIKVNAIIVISRVEELPSLLARFSAVVFGELLQLIGREDPVGKM